MVRGGSQADLALMLVATFFFAEARNPGTNKFEFGYDNGVVRTYPEALFCEDDFFDSFAGVIHGPVAQVNEKSGQEHTPNYVIVYDLDGKKMTNHRRWLLEGEATPKNPLLYNCIENMPDYSTPVAKTGTSFLDLPNDLFYKGHEYLILLCYWPRLHFGDFRCYDKRALYIVAQEQLCNIQSLEKRVEEVMKLFVPPGGKYTGEDHGKSLKRLAKYALKMPLSPVLATRALMLVGQYYAEWHLHAYWYHNELEKALVSLGADLNHADFNGETFYHKFVRSVMEFGRKEKLKGKDRQDIKQPFFNFKLDLRKMGDNIRGLFELPHEMTSRLSERVGHVGRKCNRRGQTLYTLAAKHNQLWLFRSLQTAMDPYEMYGGDVRRKDCNGQTPLMIALEEGYVHLFWSLVISWKDRTPQDILGYTTRYKDLFTRVSPALGTNMVIAALKSDMLDDFEFGDEFNYWLRTMVARHPHLLDLTATDGKKNDFMCLAMMSNQPQMGELISNNLKEKGGRSFISQQMVKPTRTCLVEVGKHDVIQTTYVGLALLLGRTSIINTMLSVAKNKERPLHGTSAEVHRLIRYRHIDGQVVEIGWQSILSLALHREAEAAQRYTGTFSYFWYQFNIARNHELRRFKDWKKNSITRDTMGRASILAESFNNPLGSYGIHMKDPRGSLTAINSMLLSGATGCEDALKAVPQVNPKQLDGMTLAIAAVTGCMGTGQFLRRRLSPDSKVFVSEVGHAQSFELTVVIRSSKLLRMSALCATLYHIGYYQKRHEEEINYSPLADLMQFGEPARQSWECPSPKYSTSMVHYKEFAESLGLNVARVEDALDEGLKRFALSRD